MTALQNLSASGWVLFAVTAGLALSFLVRVPMRAWRDDAGLHAFALGVLLVWLLWLVTP